MARSRSIMHHALHQTYIVYCFLGACNADTQEFVVKWAPAIETSLWALSLALKIAGMCTTGFPITLPLPKGIVPTQALSFLKQVSCI
jgi:hypothetical protein